MSFARRRQILWVMLLIGLVAIAIVANATTLARLSFTELAKTSHAVARLQCVSTRSEWHGGEIWTITQFTVLERDKGTLPAAVTVEMPGGSFGHLHSHVEGVPRFRAGEEAYLFLWNRADGTYSILGWSQGAFRISRDAGTQTDLVTQDSSAQLFDPATREFHREGVRQMPLAAFQLKLKKALEAGGQ